MEVPRSARCQHRWPPWLGLEPWNRTPRRDCPTQASGDLQKLGRRLIHRRRDLAGRVLVAHVGLQRMKTAPWHSKNEPPFPADPSGASQQAAGRRPLQLPQNYDDRRHSPTCGQVQTWEPAQPACWVAHHLSAVLGGASERYRCWAICLATRMSWHRNISVLLHRDTALNTEFQRHYCIKCAGDKNLANIKQTHWAAVAGPLEQGT
ncbi:hypothetical protein V8C26DRAFT_205216 [Trichoderma gracile]